MTRRPEWLPLVAVASVVILLLYARTLQFGLYWDDFDDLRPWTWSGLVSTFTGHYQPWERQEIIFYRPLTSVYFAVASTLFGFNTTALHVIPLCTLTIASTLIGMFIQREAGSLRAGVIGTILYATHPLTATAIGPWIANQYQGFVVIAVLSALLIWQSRAREGLRVAPALAVALVAAAWFKEDGLMLGPAILAVHVVRARIVGDVPMPSRRAVLMLLGITTALILWRALWLTSLFGYGLSEPWMMAANLSRAWRYALVWHTGPALLRLIVTLVKVALLIGAVWQIASRRRDAPARLVLAGLALMLMMDLPLALVSSENRWHVMGLAAVLITAGSVIAIPVRAQWAVVAVVATVFAAAASERIDGFAPCSRASLEHYKWVMTLPELPVEMHNWLATRDAACASGQFDHFTIPMRDLKWGER